MKSQQNRKIIRIPNLHHNSNKKNCYFFFAFALRTSITVYIYE